jgi:signal transduction histidine kinase
MTQTSERPLSLACVADQSAAASALHEALVALFPGATVERIDTDVERQLPAEVDCAVIHATVNATDGLGVLRRLRASGYAGAAVLVRDRNRQDSAADDASADRLGARRCELGDGSLLSLAAAVAESIRVQLGESDPASRAAVHALRQTQRLLAAGELAMRLQHSLNNPLAALLAEAQLLELEPLAPDHRASVERIIELSRRVIDVVRGLDGVGRA